MSLYRKLQPTEDDYKLILITLSIFIYLLLALDFVENLSLKLLVTQLLWIH